MHLVPLSESALNACLAEGPVHEAIPGVRCADGAMPPGFLAEHCLVRMRAEPGREWWARLWLAVAEQPARVVGSVSFKSFDPGSGSAEIGYGIAPGERRRGFAAAAVRELVAAAFARPETRRVFAQVQPGNAASRRVLERNGFAVVGESVDPEDGPVLRYEKEKPQARGPAA